MARSMLDAPFDVLYENVGALLLRLETFTDTRDELRVIGFELAPWEAQLRAANDTMWTLRARHGGMGRIGGAGQLGADQDDRVAWTRRAAAWVKGLRSRLKFAELRTDRDLTVPIGEVRAVLSPHQRNFPGTLRDLRSVIPVLRARPDLVAALALPDPLCEGEALLAEAEALEPVLSSGRGEARAYRLEAEAARKQVIELLRHLRAALPIAAKRSEELDAFLFSELRAWADGTGREPGRAKRRRVRSSPTAMSDSPPPTAASPVSATEAPSVKADSSIPGSEPPPPSSSSPMAPTNSPTVA